MSAATTIPSRARAIVKERDQGHCMRCGAAGAHEVHHRRRRGVGDDPHLVCNLITLCGPGGCHAWVHAHPELARRQGFIISMFDDEPFRITLKSFMGPVRLGCDGAIEWV